jgi:uncharacterized membrane protein
VAVVVVPLLVWGFPQGHDWSFELVRIAEYRHALADGQLPPAWAPDLYGGYGSPIFLFYAPAYLALSVAFWLVSGSVAVGAAWALVAVALIAVLSTRSMIRAATGTGHADAERVGVYLFMLHPYLVGDLYLRNANAEFVALCLAPIAISGLILVGERPRRGLLAVAAGLALVTLAHNLTALVVAAVLLVGSLALHAPRPKPGVWPSLGAGAALGLAGAAFFWVPALRLQPLMSTGELLEGKFDFHNNFTSPLALFGYEPFYAAGLLTPLVWALGAWALMRMRRDRSPRLRVLAVALAGSLVFLLLATRASVKLWESLPFLPLFQFPWRMLGPIALTSSIVGAIAYVELTGKLTARWRRVAEILVLVLCLANALPHLLAYRPLDPSVRNAMILELAPSAIREKGYAATVGDEYLPRNATAEAWRRPRPSAGPIVSATSPIEVDVDRDRGTRSRVRVRAEQPVGIELGRWAFPGWWLGIDGEDQAVDPTPVGTIGVELAAGEARIDLAYRPPKIRAATLVLSGIAGVVWLVLLMRNRHGDRKLRKT